MAGRAKNTHTTAHIQPAGMHYIRTISFYVFTIHRLYCLDADADIDDDDKLAVFSLNVFFFWKNIKMKSMLLLSLLCCYQTKILNAKQMFDSS